MNGALAYLVLGAVAVAVLVAVPVVVVLAERSRREAQQRQFSAAYGSVEAARATIDVTAVRAVRDREGVVQAVRLVRRQHPQIPLPQAAEIVRGL